MARKVKYARFHQAVDVPGPVGGLQNCLPPINKQMDLRMTAEENGLYVEATVRGIVEQFTIPYANIVVLVYDKEPVKVQSGSGVKVG